MQWPRHMLPALHSRKSRSVPPPDGVCTPGLAAAATRVRNVGGSHRSTLEGKVRKEAGQPGPALAQGTQTQGALVSRKHSTAPSHSLARSNLLPRPQQPHPAHPAAMNSEQRAGRSHGERPGWQTGRLRAAASPGHVCLAQTCVLRSPDPHQLMNRQVQAVSSCHTVARPSTRLCSRPPPLCQQVPSTMGELGTHRGAVGSDPTGSCPRRKEGLIAGGTWPWEQDKGPVSKSGRASLRREFGELYLRVEDEVWGQDPSSAVGADSPSSLS